MHMHRLVWMVRGWGRDPSLVTVNARTTVQCVPIADACACMDTYKRACVRIFMCLCLYM